MATFVLLTEKGTSKEHKVLVCVTAIKYVRVIQNNGGGHVCSEIVVSNTRTPLRVAESPQEISKAIEQAQKDE